MKKKIVVSKNGPYVVSGNIPLSKTKIVVDDCGNSIDYEIEESYPQKNSYCLCRCGKSQNKPYCDGTHMEVNFKGDETASRNDYLEEAEKIEGPELDLTDNKSLCALSRFCDNKKGDTWGLTKESSNNEKRKEAIEQSCKCAGGRLVAWEKGNNAIESEFEESIEAVRDTAKKVDGYLWVKGGVEIESCDGFVYEKRNRVALCRCGKSQNKPYCDGSHIV